MTPFQTLLVAFTVGVFFSLFGSASKEEKHSSASNLFKVIAGFAWFSIPFVLIWCIMYYINW